MDRVRNLVNDIKKEFDGPLIDSSLDIFDSKKTESKYIYGYFKQISTGEYVGGSYDSENYLVKDYRFARYYGIKKELYLEKPSTLYVSYYLNETFVEKYAEKYGYEDFTFVEAEIILKK